MLLSRIEVRPEQFQKRDTPYSLKTVEAIVDEGISLVKFDPLPLLPIEGARFVVGGDGHSRTEAINRLAAAGRLPEEWRVPTPHGDDWDIPHKLVDAREAQQNSWTANLKGTGFNACEEARVFQEMLDAGYPLDKVATLCHVSTSYVKKSLPLNGLCNDIRIAVGLVPDAGGVDKHIAQTMAERFARYQIDKAAQQQLWGRVLRHSDLTSKFVTKFLDQIGQQFTEKSKTDEGFLFAIPVQAEAVVKSFKGRADNQRRVERGLGWLMQALDEGRKDGGADVLKGYPELMRMLMAHGEAWLRQAKGATQEDATLLANMTLAA